ncbi:phospholipase D-like domain-containing protein [Paracraurococcus lichenis]|uniref:SGNH/GDSL hydrolase family protein n=1 Tax=Paracraurococcus lichenis TaxID=3064888 RepID=A0ABT9E809_9PROT|nr:hypothetical protein [Paracraurococcus sp. LOR1-02]MDO9712257.1 hypothetical protein [Paracraurococcus sp. LOR1-02]
MSLSVTTLTPANVQQSLQSEGLGALGLAGLALSTQWTDTTPPAANYDAAALTLSLPGPRAPFRGILEYGFSPATGTLAAAVGATATEFDLGAGQGGGFPSPSGGGSVLLTVTGASGVAAEVVECTGRTGDRLTVARGVANSTPQAFAAGDRVALRLVGVPRTSEFIGVDGTPLTGTCAVLRLHEAAAVRLQRLMAARYTDGSAALMLPVFSCMVFRGAQGFKAPRWFEPGDQLSLEVAGGETVSFHDRRGLIVDPIFAAAVLADLQAWLPGLTGKSSTAPIGGPGGAQPIAGLAQGTLVHVVDLHGGPYRPALAAATLVTTRADGTQSATIPASGLVTLPDGEGLEVNGAAAAPADAGRLRWGWATNGVLSRTRAVPPALPTTGTPAGTPAPSLPRQFLRLAVVDTVWSLLGNRTGAEVLGIPADDRSTPDDLLPAIHDQVTVTYLADGPDTLATAAAVLARPSQDMVIVASPILDGQFATPTQAGANAHWPVFPDPNTGTGFPGGQALPSPADGLQAAWIDAQDVLVTVAADKVPDGAHIRIFPRQFVTVEAISAQPSFVRGDGGATIAAATKPTSVRLPNPFALAPGQAQPSPANLVMDIVVTPRQGNRRVWANTRAPVAAGPAPAPADPFAGVNGVAAMPPTFLSVAPSPLFGVPATIPPPGTAPGDVISFLRSLASEESPRQGPRLPTMARFETVVTTGTTGGAGPALAWEAVLTGGRWARETRSALHASGNPGNPAGPDLHAPGIHVTGALAYDLALHAMRRAQPIIPLPGTPGPSPGWVVATNGDNFTPPQDNTATNTGIGVLLETVASGCETPELSGVTPPAPGSTVQSAVNALASALGVPAPTVTTANPDRLIRLIRRECVVSAAGLRDALWSLRRALREARELIYIESPQFARTARPSGAAAVEVDLVGEIAASLAAHPNLRVIVCTPRQPDFAPPFRGWSRQHFRARTEAVGNLLAVAPDRVVAFHPVGFPGRSAAIRTTSVVVDDVWSLVGATHFRRRGMTFDGSAAIASFDRQMDGGYSRNVRSYRRVIMAAKLGVADPATLAPSAAWVRLGSPRGAFDLVASWLGQGGLGAIQPLNAGPADTAVLPASDDMADPDGTTTGNYLGLFASLIAEAGS